MPKSFGVICAAGLVSALSANGIWDDLTWVAPTLPVVVCGLFCTKSR